MNRQMEDYQYIVNYQARQTHRRIPVHARNYISVEDLEQEGWIAFIRACRNYDDSHDVKFTTFLTTNLILAFGVYIAHSLAKKRVPLEDILYLDEEPSETGTHGLASRYLGYTDPQFNAIEMKLSLETVLEKIPKQYAFLVEWFLNEDVSHIRSIGMACREMHVGRCKLRSASKHIMKHLYA